MSFFYIMEHNNVVFFTTINLCYKVPKLLAWATHVPDLRQNVDAKVKRAESVVNQKAIQNDISRYTIDLYTVQVQSQLNRCASPKPKQPWNSQQIPDFGELIAFFLNSYQWDEFY